MLIQNDLKIIINDKDNIPPLFIFMFDFCFG